PAESDPERSPGLERNLRLEASRGGEAAAGGLDPLVDQARIDHLPRVRTEAEDAEAAFDDRAQRDARRISPPLQPDRRLPDGCAQLCRAAAQARKVDRARHQAPADSRRQVIARRWTMR